MYIFQCYLKRLPLSFLTNSNMNNNSNSVYKIYNSQKPWKSKKNMKSVGYSKDMHNEHNLKDYLLLVTKSTISVMCLNPTIALNGVTAIAISGLLFGSL